MKKTIIFIFIIGFVGFISSVAQSNSHSNITNEMVKDENQAPKKFNKLKLNSFFKKISLGLIKNIESSRNYIINDIIKDQLDTNKIKTNKLKSNPKIEEFLK